MVKRLLALAALSVLASGCVSARTDTTVGVAPVNAPIGRAAQLGPDIIARQSAAPSRSEAAPPPALVVGHATGQGSTAPQPPGPPASSEPATPSGPLPAPHATCPSNQHLGIACIAP